jgi:hypothetical protein
MKLDHGQPELEAVALERCIKGATYPVWWSVSSWSTSIVSSIRHALHRRVAEFYARRYLAEHGRLPEGLHHVVVSVGPTNKRGDADIKHLFSSGSMHPSEQMFEADITYPAAPSARTREAPPAMGLDRRQSPESAAAPSASLLVAPAAPALFAPTTLNKGRCWSPDLADQP